MHFSKIILIFASKKYTHFMEYYKIYMQLDTDGATAKETISDFGLYCMEIPFSVAQSAKDLTARDWYDEDGTDFYMPVNGLKMSAYEMKVKFGYKGDKFSANEKINGFLSYLKQGAIKMYCDYTKIGRTNVVLSKIDDSATLVREDKDGDLLIFTVIFKVYDPVTDIEPTTDANGNVTALTIKA